MVQESGQLKKWPAQIALPWPAATVVTRLPVKSGGARVRDVEHAFFAPVVMSCIGGLAPAASATLKRLLTLVADKEDEPLIQHRDRLAEDEAVVRPAVRCRDVSSLYSIIEASFL